MMQLFKRPTRSITRRGLALGSVCAVAVAVAVGAGGASGATKAGGGNLTLWQWQAGTPYIQVFKDAGTRYSKAFGGNLSIVSVPFTNYFTKFKTAIAAGAVPDVMEMSWTGDYRDLINANALLPLDKYLKTGFPKFNGPVMKSLTYKGHVYGIPMDLNTLTIAYNEGIFQKLGLSVPKSFAQLLALAKPLRAAGYQPLAVNIKDGWPGGDLWFSQVAYTDPTETLIRKAEVGGASWNNAAFIRAAQNVQDMASSHLLADGAQSLSFTDLPALFGSQQAAMVYPVGNFDTPLLDAADGGKFQYGLFPFPPLNYPGAKPVATGGPAIIFSIPAKAKNVAGAVNFIREATNKAAFAELVKNNYIPSAPANISGNTNPIYKTMVGFQATAQTRAIFVPAVYTALLNGIQGLLAGQMTAAQVAQSMQAAAG